MEELRFTKTLSTLPEFNLSIARDAEKLKKPLRTCRHEDSATLALRTFPSPQLAQECWGRQAGLLTAVGGLARQLRSAGETGQVG